MNALESRTAGLEDRQFLSLLLELDELENDRSARLQISLSFLWLLLGFALGGGLVMIWAG